MVAVAMSNLFQ